MVRVRYVCFYVCMRVCHMYVCSYVCMYVCMDATRPLPPVLQPMPGARVCFAAGVTA